MAEKDPEEKNSDDGKSSDSSTEMPKITTEENKLLKD